MFNFISSASILTTLRIMSLFLFWALYIPIGTLSSFRGVNYANYITIGIDLNLSYHAVLAIPYMFAFLIGPVFILMLIIKNHDSKEFKQAFIVTFLLTLSASYLVYYFFPTNVPEYKGIPSEAMLPGTMNEFVRSSYSLLSPWNSFPAFHVSSAWLIFRFIRKFIKSSLLNYGYLLWFTLMCWGAASLNLHTILDLVAGLFLAELFYQFWLNNKEFISQRFFKDTNYSKSIIVWSCINLILITLLTYCYSVGLFELTLK